MGSDSKHGEPRTERHAAATAGLASKALGRAAHRAAATLDAELATIQEELEAALPECVPQSELAHRLHEARASLSRAKKVTKRLRALGRRPTRNPQLMSLSRSLAEVRSVLTSLVPSSVELVIQPLNTAYVRLDPTELSQLFVHLVANAADASEADDRVLVRAGSIVVNEASHDGTWHWRPRRPPRGRYATIQVTDTGSGMAPHVREAAFDPFYTTRSERAGVGLDVVLGTVHETGGYVGIKTAIGEGTTVQLLLPAAASSYSELTAIRDPATTLHNVMVVANEPTIRAFITGALASSGFEVLSESDGPSAMARVTRDQPDLDLLVVDMDVRGLGGLDLADAMQRRFPELPVLFLTDSEATAHHHSRTPSLGRELAKPFRVSELMDAVRLALSDVRSNRTPVIQPRASAT